DKNSGEGGGGGNKQQQQGGHVTGRQRQAIPDATSRGWKINWEINPEAYENLCRLYSDYFHRIHGGVIMKDQTKKVLIDLAICQLNSFVAIDALLDRKLLLVLVNSHVQSSGGARLQDCHATAKTEFSVGQLIDALPFRMQRPMSWPSHQSDQLECDSVRGPACLTRWRARVHAGQLLDGALTREKMDEALLERTTASWFLDIAVLIFRMS
uniref:NPH3 domain-containing protein n=1 Tax=Macrostomum lignano TaxID=282301 RepID=A0A1I8FE32_9PLAT